MANPIAANLSYQASISSNGNVSNGTTLTNLDTVTALPYLSAAPTTITTGTQTITAALIASRSIFQETGSTAATYTFDTGANIDAGVVGLAVGDVIPVIVSNSSSATVTMAGATGCTLGGTMTVPTLTTRTFYLYKSAANTFTVY